MKIKLIYIIPILLLVVMSACTGKQKTEEKPAPLYTQPKTVNLNIKEGYTLNSITGDTIKPLINSLGDTIVTGRPIPAKGKLIHPDSVSKPQVVPYRHSTTSYNAHPNVHKIPDNLIVIPVKKDSLTKIVLKENSKDSKLQYVINSTSDTVNTGIPIPTIGKTVVTTQPQPTPALPLRFKDAANTNMQYLDVDQGMASSYILDILEDKNGNIWFATNGGGLSKYNGESFIHFTENEGLSNNIVFSILEDKNGNLWFGTNGGGISMYNGDTFTQFTENEGLSDNVVMSLLEDKSGNIWFATYGRGVSKYDGETFTHFTENEGLIDNVVIDLLEDSKGNLWFSTANGVCKYNGDTFTHFSKNEGLSHNRVLSLLEDKKGNIWFATAGGGVSMYNGESFTHFTENEGLSNNIVWNILEDKNGNLWFATSEGVCMYNSESFTHFSKNEGLSNNFVMSLMEDNSGNIWFATFGGGVSKYNSESFTHFSENEGLSNVLVKSIQEDNSGNIWFATNGGGVSKYNGESFKHITVKNGLKHNVVWNILIDKNGNIWFATYNSGVSLYNGESFTHFTEKEGLIGNFVRSMLEDKSGNIWFATSRGICKYNGEAFTHFTENEGLSNNVARFILEDKDGNFWFASYGGGVSKYNGESFIHFTEKEGLSNNHVSFILEDKSGNLWFATNGGGISKYNGETFTHFTEKEGLSDNVVQSILEDKEGNIWLSTENGMNQLVPKKNMETQANKGKNNAKITYAIKTYLKNDGLKGMDFHRNSALIDQKNRMWLGSGKSLTMLDMNKHIVNVNPPKIHLEQLEINEKFIDYRNISDDLTHEVIFNGVEPFENYPLNLELPYDKNHLTFHFVGIDWSAPNKVQYSYIMEGLNSTWSQPSYESKADYRNLPYGTYTFKVRAIGVSGEWSQAFEYEFTIHPPWWHTWWARTIYVLSALVIVYILIRWRTEKFKKRQIELETEVDNATKEIRQQKDQIENAHIETQKQKEEIEEAHKEITDSIRYAKRIQSAILPPQKLVKDYLPDSFVLYKPKDVVAGDFYWMENVSAESRVPSVEKAQSGISELSKNKLSTRHSAPDTILYAAADCTGHGVPGAMVSVICNNGLNRSVREYGLTEPGKILDKTREIVIQEFEKSEEEVKDGMDIALCSIQGNTLQYAGAHNPLWIIRNGEILETKANKQPIGKFDNPQTFTTHTVELEKGDSIYIFSDGFADQFGGEKGKKYKSANMKRLFLSLQGLKMNEQKQAIENAFNEWKGNLEQLDDVCIIGVRV